MKLELDHMFILVEAEAKVADLLLELGMQEGSGNVHPGQGTSNRRFYFSNGMLEFLWVHDEEEARNGPGKDLLFVERANNSSASPFGVILHRKDNSSLDMPFDGWKYQPDYFKPPWEFHIGRNASNLLEPLCIYVPFIEPQTRSTASKTDDGPFKSISNVQVYTASEPLSEVLSVVNTADRISIEQDIHNLMVITFDDNKCGMSKDLRPDIPLIVHW